MRSGTLAGCVNQYPDLDLNQGPGTDRMDAAGRFGGSNANPLHHRDKQSRRLELHQHLPNQINTVKTGAFFSRATSANQHEREESNPVRRFWRPLALPGAHSCIAVVHSKDRQGIRRELNPYLLVHSQACSDRYTTDTMSISSSTRI